MYRIAVVDDDYRVITKLTRILSGYFGENAYLQDDYGDGLEFVRNLDGSSYDIVFVDLEMPLMNGEDAVRILRSYDPSEKVCVIYMSDQTDRLVSLFAQHPFAFLVKPVQYSEVYAVMDKVLQRRMDRTAYLTVVADRREVRIPVYDILWLQSAGHRVEIKLRSQEQSLYTYTKLNELYKSLKVLEKSFLRIHHSFVVNRAYVTKYTPDSVHVRDRVFSISLKYRQDVIGRGGEKS